MSNENVKTAAPSTVNKEPEVAKTSLEASPATIVKLASQLADLQKSFKAQQAKEQQSGQVTKTPEEIDWSRVNEEEILTLDIPVATIEHGLETYLDVKLLDSNYIARWVQVASFNLGPKLKRGFSFVTKEDLDPTYPHPFDFDEKGRYSFNDVVCLKIHKKLYYTKIKANMQRATVIQRKKEVTNPHIPALTDSAVANAESRGAMQFYQPPTTEK